MKTAGPVILLVEDELIIAEDLKLRLARLGYNVAAIVLSGEDALQSAEQSPPDLVLMDIKLQGRLDGIETGDQIRIRFDIPVVYLSSYADEATIRRARLTEPFGYLVKPFEEKELHSTIEMALYKHRMEQKLKESERWLAATLKSIGDAVVATDARGGITFMNHVAERLTGWKQEDALGKDLSDIFAIVNEQTRIPVDDPARRALREGNTVGLDNLARLIRKDGDEIPIDDSAAPIRDDKGRITGAVLVFHDITERRRTEQSVKVQYIATRVLAEAATLPEAAPKILECVCESFGWDLGELWVTDQVAGRLHFVDLWRRSSLAVPEFEKHTRSLALSRGEGLVGRIWETGEATWVSDVVNDRGFIRAALAAKEGLHGAFAFPIRLRNEIFGVAAFYSRHVRQQEDDVLDMSAAIGNQIGQFIERTQTEAALRESEQRFRSLVETTSDWIWQIDIDGKYTYASPRVMEFLGYDPAEVIGKKPIDFMPADEATRVAAELSTYMNERRPIVRFENRNLHKDGHAVVMETSGVPILDSDGVLQGYRGVDRDITESKRAVDILIENEDRYRTLFDLSPSGILLEDLDGHIIDANVSLSTSLGYSRDELLEMNVRDLSTQGSGKELEHNLARILSGETLIHEVQNVKKDGTTCLLELRERKVPLSNGSVGILVTSFDITERKRMEERVRESEKRYKSLLSTVTDYIYTVDIRDGHHVGTTHGPGCVAVTGYTPEEYRANPHLWHEMIHPEDLPMVEESVARASNGENVEIEHRIIHKDGSVRWVRNTTVPRRDRDGTLLSCDGLISDITLRKRAEEQTSASLKEKELLLREVHHRVKNNLQVVSSLLNIQSGYVRDERSLKIFKECQHRIKSMSLIHQQLYQSGSMAKIDFGNYIRALAAQLFSSYGVSSANIALKVNVEEVPLSIDKAIPCGIIVNELISNSLKHGFAGKKKGEIMIMLQAGAQATARLTVSDDGVGISADVDVGTTESLGLKLVHMLASQIGGSVKLDRAHGTRFVIAFPVEYR